SPFLREGPLLPCRARLSLLPNAQEGDSYSSLRDSARRSAPWASLTFSRVSPQPFTIATECCTMQDSQPREYCCTSKPMLDFQESCLGVTEKKCVVGGT